MAEIRPDNRNVFQKVGDGINNYLYDRKQKIESYENFIDGTNNEFKPGFISVGGEDKDTLKMTVIGNRRDRTFDGGEGLRYPLDRIERDSDYLEIKVLEYKPPGFETRGTGQSIALQTSSESLKNNEVILGHIFLPIPEAITDSNGVTWGTDSLNGLAAAGLGIGLKTMGAPSLGAAGKVLTSGTKNAIGDLISDDMTRTSINSSLAASAINTLVPNANIQGTGVFTRQTGAVLNPNMELLFGTVQLRTFSFSFDLTPRSKNESNVIKNIIRAFKKSLNAKNGSSGEGSSGLFIQSPDVFQLTYKTGAKDHKFLHRFKPMALLNMVVNYTGAGTYATYDNTAPVHTKIDLTFQELNPIYSEDYDTPEGEGGTGF